MKRILVSALLALTLAACSGEPVNYKRGVYLLLDTSGTYTQELDKARAIINYILSELEAGDTFVVATIDSGSFSEKNIVARVVLDSRPSAANRQKREFAAAVEEFTNGVRSSAFTDISGGLFQAIEYLNEADVGSKSIFIFSDMKEELPEGFVRDLELALDGFVVKALNVTKLRSDNVNPREYMDRMEEWQYKVQQGGGEWILVNDLERPAALSF